MASNEYLKNIITPVSKRSFCSVVGDDFDQTISQPARKAEVTTKLCVNSKRNNAQSHLIHIY